MLILFSVPGFNQELSPKTANYEINISLDTDQKQITATQLINWKNPSTDTIHELQFHLYYNAFKNTNSTFYKEQDGISRFGNFEREESCTWSWMDVQSLTDAAGNSLVEQMEFIAPDDGNAQDQTVLRVPLANSILPGETGTFQMSWQSKIPNVRPRTGYNNDFYFFAQWFPKVGVYEPAGTRFAWREDGIVINIIPPVNTMLTLEITK